MHLFDYLNICTYSSILLLRKNTYVNKISIILIDRILDNPSSLLKWAALLHALCSSMFNVVPGAVTSLGENKEQAKKLC